MRDLRAELSDWSNDAPIEWQPADGDILVGFLREPRSADGNGATAQVIVEEEKTGIVVAVRLDSPVLSGFFDLHNPRSRDRVGIKFIGLDADGIGRYVMVVDRDRASKAEQDDVLGASPEERDYIEQMMVEGSTAQEASGPVGFACSALARDNGAAKPLIGASILLMMLCAGAVLAICPQWLMSLFGK